MQGETVSLEGKIKTVYSFEISKSIARFFLIGVIFYLFKISSTSGTALSTYLIPSILLLTNIVYLMLLIVLYRIKKLSWSILKSFHYFSLIFCPLTFSVIIARTGGEDSVFVAFYYFYIVVIPLSQVHFSRIETYLSELLIIAAYPGFLYLLGKPRNTNKIFWQVGFEFLIGIAVLVFHAIIRNDQERLSRLSNELHFLAITDHLTGLFNRRYMQRRIAEEFEKVAKKQTGFSVAIGDIDDFKVFNDTYGHTEVDKLLTKLAEIITKNTRKTDIAARFGGEEFVILLPETTKEQACEILNRIREQFESETAKRYGRETTICFGVASYPEDALNPEGLIKRSDRALYDAKRSGKNRVHVCKGLIA